MLYTIFNCCWYGVFSRYFRVYMEERNPTWNGREPVGHIFACLLSCILFFTYIRFIHVLLHHYNTKYIPLEFCLNTRTIFFFLTLDHSCETFCIVNVKISLAGFWKKKMFLKSVTVVPVKKLKIEKCPKLQNFFAFFCNKKLIKLAGKFKF